MRCFLLLGVLAGLTAGTSATRAEDGQLSLSGGDALTLRTSPGNPERSSLEAAQFLVALEKLGLLEFEPVVDPKGRDIATLMVDEMRFIRGSFPAVVDDLICRQNLQVCTPASADPPAPGAWQNKAGDSINLPKLLFAEVVELAPVIKVAGESLDLLRREQNVDCSRFKLSCEEVIIKLNAANGSAFDLGATTEVILPQRAYETKVEFAKKQAQAIDFSDAVFRRAIGVGSISMESAYGEEDLYNLQEEMFDLIGFPFAALPTLDDVPDGYKQPVKIGIVDTWLDEGHCDLRDRVRVLRNVDPPAFIAERGHCGDEGPFSRPADHGSHVVGIIGAALNKLATAGLQPFAALLFQGVDLSKIRTSAGHRAFADDLHDEIFDNDIDIVNISWQYQITDGDIDLIKKTIKGLQFSSLFVVAAGNDARRFEGDCSVLPACFTQMPNVLTVVGLDRDRERPELWIDGDKGSNSSASFQIGAIAANVTSTASGDRVANASGTSQAAPQVAAAAAYVLSAFRDHFGTGVPVAPARIKNRLIYTAEMSNDLLDHIFGGRLNMSRAMKVNIDQLTIRTSRGDKTYAGELQSFGNPDDEFVGCKGGGPASRVTKDALERMVYLPATRKHVLFFREDSSDPASALLRATACELATQTNRASFASETGEVIEFPFKDILDFTSSMH